MIENMERDFKGIWIPKEIWLDSRLSALDKMVFAVIESLIASDGSGCSASNEYLAKFCQCSESKIQKSIKVLKDLGLVRQSSFDGRIRHLHSCLVEGNK